MLKLTGVIFIFVWFKSEFGGHAYAGDEEEESPAKVDLSATMIWGPGLLSSFNLPVRYFYIQFVDVNGNNLTTSLENDEQLKVTIYDTRGARTRTWLQVLNNHDGSYLARYRHFASYPYGQRVLVEYRGQHLGQSPYDMPGPIYHENCDCPEPDMNKWLSDIGCPDSYQQIDDDLAHFPQINIERDIDKIFAKFSSLGAHSLCHYSIVGNKINVRTRGQHVGFKMFSNAILLSLTRKVTLPDMEFVVNLGDYPLESMSDSPLPIVSWCGSDDTADIVIPTYEITEATLEMQGRHSLDVFSVVNNSDVPWSMKSDLSFFRGRDSSRERIKLVTMSREHPDLIDAKLTHIFFFDDRKEEIGDTVERVPFYEFFQHKYQLSLDGTVAAYRLPYLLAGNSLIFKQASTYYEHFYKQLRPNVHYIPINRDLSDLLEKLQWAKDNDAESEKISHQAQAFARDNLDPKNVFCYHALLLKKYAERQVFKPKVYDDMEEVPQVQQDCNCHSLHDEF